MEKILNFRQLAKGLKNNDGKEINCSIYRCALPYYATENDKHKIKQLGINSIYDLRAKEEVDKFSMLQVGGVKTLNFDILCEYSYNNSAFDSIDNIEMITHQEMEKLYNIGLFETNEYQVLLDNILKQSEKGFLFHCLAGKDRTGVLGAILMMIFDYDYNDIVKEYLLIDSEVIPFLKDGFKQEKKLSDLDIDKYVNLFTVKEEYIKAYLDRILNEYHTFDNFLKYKLNIDEDKKNLFKEKYLV